MRGFSRRLTTVVVPLALVLAAGTVQTSVDRAVGTAATEQLRAALRADLVVTGPRRRGLDGDVAAVEAAPGVDHAYPLAGPTARIRTDDEDVPGLSALSWETCRCGCSRPGPATVDPGVVDGSLTDLDEPGTVAVSTDAPFETGHGLGDDVEVRLPGDRATTLRVVAVYERGLGFGGYLVGPPRSPTSGCRRRPTRCWCGRRPGAPRGLAERASPPSPRRRTPTRRPPRTPGSSASPSCCCSPCSPSWPSAPRTPW